MNRPEPDSTEARRRSLAAAEWLVKRDRGLTAVEQDEFLEWLAADPRHGEWLALHRQLGGDFGRLLRWRPEHSDEPNPDLLARPAPRRWWWRPVIALATAAVVTVVWLQVRNRADAPAAVAGIPGAVELERRILQDGSTVDLNRGAVVNVVYSATERRVRLERGEALFNVVKEEGRPFIVRAGGVDVRAVGTAFNVRLESNALEVLVTEGTVEIEADRSRDTPTLTAAPLIVAGQRATVSFDRPADPEIRAVSAEESTRMLAWQPQLLDFASAPLERAVAEFNRRNRSQLVIADEELSALPIVASIRSDRVEAFVQFLVTTAGVQAERRGDEIVLRRRR